MRNTYLDSLFANSSVSSSDDDDLPAQVRNVVNSELGFRSEVTLKHRVEHLPGGAEGGGKAIARHTWRSCGTEIRRRFVEKRGSGPVALTLNLSLPGDAMYAHLRSTGSPLVDSSGNVQSDHCGWGWETGVQISVQLPGRHGALDRRCFTSLRRAPRSSFPGLQRRALTNADTHRMVDSNMRNRRCRETVGHAQCSFFSSRLDITIVG